MPGLRNGGARASLRDGGPDRLGGGGVRAAGAHLVGTADPAGRGGAAAGVPPAGHAVRAERRGGEGEGRLRTLPRAVEGMRPRAPTAGRRRGAPAARIGGTARSKARVISLRVTKLPPSAYIRSVTAPTHDLSKLRIDRDPPPEVRRAFGRTVIFVVLGI